MSAARPAADPLTAMLQLEARSRAVLTEAELLWDALRYIAAALIRESGF